MFNASDTLVPPSSEKFRELFIVPVPQILKEVVDAARAGSVCEV